MNKKYYAVRRGRKIGVFESWEECQPLVDKFNGAIYKSFTDKKAAYKFAGMEPPAEEPKENSHVRENREYFEGIYVRCIYSSEKHGVSIAIYRGNDGGSYTITGNMLPTTKNVKYVFSGKWVENQKYGTQFKAESHEVKVGNDKDNIIAYLSSGIIKGIGKKLAGKIVDKFGDKTLEIMDNDIYALTHVQGVSVKKVDKIKDSYRENGMSQECVITLGKYGISPKLAVKAYQRFKENTMQIIKEKPYMLSVVSGITFPVADGIAEKTEEYERNYERFKMCATYVLLNNENNMFKDIIGQRPAGSIGMDKDDFGKVMLSLLRFKNVNGSFILEQTIRMINDRQLVYKKTEDGCFIFLAGMYRIEEATAAHILRIASKKEEITENLDALIEKAEKVLKISLCKEQKEAVVKAMTSNLSLIIGPPGTGKTTTIKVISLLYRWIFKGQRIFLAPSGKAASRIRETTNETAMTVHSGAGIGTDLICDLIDEEIKMQDSLVVVDEMSMLDARTAYQLFASIDESCKVVLCGDDEQLPSVGAGAVLRDLIDSHVINVTELSIIYRQGAGSNIYQNSLKIRKGESDLIYGSDFRLIECNETKKMEEEMVRKYLEKIKEFGISNVMMISPFRDHDAGVYVLNEKVQQEYNPVAAASKEVKYGSNIFRIGDVVMQLKNDTENNVVNGDIGMIVSIDFDEDDYEMRVQFIDSIKVYNKTNIEELILAYAYTVHKSQGSEAKCVITCLHMMHSLMLKRNMFYTAVTRAKEEVIIFGQEKAIIQAINTQDKSKRNTSLKMHLRTKFGELMPLE